MSGMASQISGVSNVCWTICLGADQRKHQSCALLAFVRGIHRWPVDSPHKGLVTQKMFLLRHIVNETLWHCSCTVHSATNTLHYTLLISKSLVQMDIIQIYYINQEEPSGSLRCNFKPMLSNILADTYMRMFIETFIVRDQKRFTDDRIGLFHKSTGNGRTAIKIMSMIFIVYGCPECR